MPVTTERETRPRSRAPLWLLPLAPLLLLFALVVAAPGVAPEEGQGVQVGPAGLGVMRRRNQFYHQGFNHVPVPEGRSWVLRIGNWHWAVTVEE